MLHLKFDHDLFWRTESPAGVYRVRKKKAKKTVANSGIKEE